MSHHTALNSAYNFPSKHTYGALCVEHVDKSAHLSYNAVLKNFTTSPDWILLWIYLEIYIYVLTLGPRLVCSRLLLTGFALACVLCETTLQCYTMVVDTILCISDFIRETLWKAVEFLIVFCIGECKYLHGGVSCWNVIWGWISFGINVGVIIRVGMWMIMNRHDRPMR